MFHAFRAQDQAGEETRDVVHLTHLRQNFRRTVPPGAGLTLCLPKYSTLRARFGRSDYRRRSVLCSPPRQASATTVRMIVKQTASFDIINQISKWTLMLSRALHVECGKRAPPSISRSDASVYTVSTLVFIAIANTGQTVQPGGVAPLHLFCSVREQGPGRIISGITLNAEFLSPSDARYSESNVINSSANHRGPGLLWGRSRILCFSLTGREQRSDSRVKTAGDDSETVLRYETSTARHSVAPGRQLRVQEA